MFVCVRVCVCAVFVLMQQVTLLLGPFAWPAGLQAAQSHGFGAAAARREREGTDKPHQMGMYHLGSPVVPFCHFFFGGGFPY